MKHVRHRSLPATIAVGLAGFIFVLVFFGSRGASSIVRSAVASPEGDDSFSWDEKSEKEIAKREKKVDRVRAWFHLSSRDYEVYSAIDARYTAEVSFFMDTFRKKFGSIFQGPSRSGRRPELYFFEHDRDYKAWMDQIGESSLRNSGGIYLGRWDGYGRFTQHAFYAHLQGQDAESRKFGGNTRGAAYVRQTLLHEGTHQIVQEKVGPHVVPSWFTEGLATYFELWDIRASVDENLKRRASRLKCAREFWESYRGGSFPSFPELLKIRQWAPDDFGPVTKAHYAAAESLAMFLIGTKEGRERLNAVYRAVQEGKDLSKEIDSRTQEQWQERWHHFIDTTLQDAR